MSKILPNPFENLPLCAWDWVFEVKNSSPISCQKIWSTVDSDHQTNNSKSTLVSLSHVIKVITPPKLQKKALLIPVFWERLLLVSGILSRSNRISDAVVKSAFPCRYNAVADHTHHYMIIWVCNGRIWKLGSIEMAIFDTSNMDNDDYETAARKGNCNQKHLYTHIIVSPQTLNNAIWISDPAFKRMNIHWQSWLYLRIYHSLAVPGKMIKSCIVVAAMMLYVCYQHKRVNSPELEIQSLHQHLFCSSYCLFSRSLPTCSTHDRKRTSSPSLCFSAGKTNRCSLSTSQNGACTLKYSSNLFQALCSRCFMRYISPLLPKLRDKHKDNRTSSSANLLRSSSTLSLEKTIRT